LDKQKSENPALILVMKRYYSMKDLEENKGSHWYGIFCALVGDEFLSDTEIASRFYIEIRTLNNYKRRFNDFAERIVNGKLFSY